MNLKKPTTMKKFFKPLALLFCVGFIASCAKNNAVTVPSDPDVKNPIADFTDTVDAQDGFTYHFSSLAQNFTKLEWRFGDDSLRTDTNPTHIYQTTGSYTVDLETYSTSGLVSHKQVVINIQPDDMLQLTTEKTGVDNQLKFIPHLKGNLHTIAWTFNAVDPSTSAVTTTTSSAVNPIVTFAFGSFNSFSVTATTDKGSVVTISKNVTTDGIVTDITLSRTYFNSTNENSDVNENSSKLIDGNPDTKFGFYSAFPVPEIYTIGFAAQETVKMYGVENGNDSESTRDPKEWYVDGSNDKDNPNSWVALDHQVLTQGFADYLTSIGQNSTRYKRFFYYPIAHPQAFNYYRWRIISTFGTAFQIEEFRLYR